MTTTCLDRETAAAYLSGHLEPDEAQRFAGHIAECLACQQLIKDLSGMIDKVREALLYSDNPKMEKEIPPVDAIKQRSRRLTAPSSWAGQVIAMASSVLKRSPETLTRSLFPVRWWLRGAVGTLAVILALAAVLHFMDRKVVSADQILRLAHEANVNSQTIPNRIVHRVWKESLINGLGPLPDGEYRFEYWIDNVNNRMTYLRYDQDGNLREGNWWLADGTAYGLIAHDSNHVQVTVGPSDQEIMGAINNLPQDSRDKVMLLYQKDRRPFYTLAADRINETGRDIAESLAGQRTDSTVSELDLSGRKAYRIFYHKAGRTDSRITQWDISHLILGNTYSTIEMQETGYRTDGLLYLRNRVLIEDQVFLPGDLELSVFKPGPFPPGAAYKNVSAKERVNFLLKRLGLAPVEQN